MVFNKKIKIACLLLLVLVFGVLIFLSIITTNYRNAKEVVLTQEEIANLMSNLREENDYNFEITINKNPIYINNVEKVNYFYISEENANQYVDLDFKISSKEKFKYVVLDEKYDKEKGFYIDFTKTFDVIIFNDEVYYKKTFKFTCLPIVNLVVGEEISDVDHAAIVEIYSKDYNNENLIHSVVSHTLVKIRGGTSFTYPKKQYRLKLRADGKANEISLLGMKADEDWILDAMYADNAKIRNKLSFDIWNEMYETSRNNDSTNYKSEYVDVYINQEYNGLYMLKEVIDWKKLALDKNNENGSGLLVKGITYDNISKETYDIAKESKIMLPFEIEYPKLQEDYSKYWDNIIPRIYTNYFDREKMTEEYLLETFDIYNYNDYKLLMNFICARDNFNQKNVLLSLKNLNKDTKVILTPWDLDMTYGYAWGDDTETHLYENPDSINMIANLWVNSDNINNLLIERYKELRKDVFTVENVNKKIDSYYNQIRYSAQRDSEKWININLEEEVNKIKDWVAKRIEILDKEILR